LVWNTVHDVLKWGKAKAKPRQGLQWRTGHSFAGLKGVYNGSGRSKNVPVVRARGGIGRREGLRIQKIALFSGFMRLLAKSASPLVLLHEMLF
jgi:hypothetical protein